MLKNDFKFVVYEPQLLYFQDAKFKGRIELFNQEEELHFRKYFFKTDYHYALLGSRDNVAYYHAVLARNKVKLPYYISKERFLQFPKSLIFKKHSYISSLIDKTLGKFQSSGLLDYWHESMVNLELLKIKYPKKIPKITNDHMFAAYIGLLAGYLISCVVFLFECTNKWPRKLIFKAKSSINPNFISYICLRHIDLQHVTSREVVNLY